MRGMSRQFLPPGNHESQLGADGRLLVHIKPLKIRCYFRATRWPAACRAPIDQSEGCPVPRVASESNAFLPPLHNSGVRHRTAGSDSGDRTSPFAALVGSDDALTARAPASRAPANRAASATDRSQRSSEPP